MAFTATAQWDCRTSGSDSSGGGFDTSVTGFATDGAATSATGNSPVFSSASYTFVAGDVGAWIYIGAGTNWTQGWYQIASVAAGAATLSAAIGQAVAASGGNASGLNTVAGCATTASPTGATWGLDYSQQNSNQITFTDLVIDATTNTKFTSAAFPVGKNFIGNVLNVTSGTGFTVQRVAIVSTSGTVATCDKSLGTLSSTGGNGKLGGALLTVNTGVNLMIHGNTVWVKSGTYTITSQIDQANSVAANAFMYIRGYGSAHADEGTKPLITTATNSTNLFRTGSGGNTATIFFINLSLSNTAGTRGTGITVFAQYNPVLINCLMDGFSTAVSGAFNQVIASGCEIKNCTTNAISITGSILMDGCYIHSGGAGGNGVNSAGGSGSIVITHSIIAANNIGISSSGGAVYVVSSTIANNVSHGMSLSSATSLIDSSIIYGNGGFGITCSSAAYIAMKNNAFGSNTSGNRSNVNVVSPADITLTANPFTASGSGDYSLNSTAGGGAACKAVGYPGVFPGGLSTGALDIGAVQTAAAATGGMLVHPGMSGGMRG